MFQYGGNPYGENPYENPYNQYGGFLGLTVQKNQDEIDAWKERWGNFKDKAKDFGRRTSDSLRSGFSNLKRRTSDTINSLKAKYKDYRDKQADQQVYDLAKKAKEMEAMANYRRLKADLRHGRDQYLAEQKLRRSTPPLENLSGGAYYNFRKRKSTKRKSTKRSRKYRRRR